MAIFPTDWFRRERWKYYDLNSVTPRGRCPSLPQSAISQCVLWSNIRLSGFADFIVRMKSWEWSWFEEINNNQSLISSYNSASRNDLSALTICLPSLENNFPRVENRSEVYKNRLDVLLLSLTNSYNAIILSEWSGRGAGGPNSTITLTITQIYL